MTVESLSRAPPGYCLIQLGMWRGTSEYYDWVIYLGNVIVSNLCHIIRNSSNNILKRISYKAIIWSKMPEGDCPLRPLRFHATNYWHVPRKRSEICLASVNKLGGYEVHSILNLIRAVWKGTRIFWSVFIVCGWSRNPFLGQCFEGNQAPSTGYPIKRGRPVITITRPEKCIIVGLPSIFPNKFTTGHNAHEFPLL